MYKNRSRGLKKSSSALTTTSSSTLGREDEDRDVTAQREPLRQREVSNIISQNERQTERNENGNESDAEHPPFKKPALGSNVTKSKAVPAEQSRPVHKPVRDKSVKSSLLNNYVDLDVSTMYMAFSSKFEELLTKSGLKLQDGDEPLLLRKDQALFVRNLTILLSEKDDNIDSFLQGLETFMENNYNFKKMLYDTQTDPAYEDARSSVQDSLIRMLLCVDSIQPKVIVLLLQKIVELIQRDPEQIRQDKTPWVELIVKRLCFLDRVVDGTALYQDLFRLLEMAPITVQQEVIYNLPYMMGDAHHDEVASRLVALMESKQELTPAVLEALGHLPLSGEQNDEIRTKMMSSLKRTPVEYLPMIVKFISLDEQASHHDEVINGLRTGLPFTKVGDRLLLQDRMSQQGAETSRHSNQAVIAAELASSKALTFRNLRGAFLSIPSLALAWLRNIRSIESAKDHRPIDIVMLLMMHSKASNRRKQVELVWRNRIKTGAFTDALLEETFEVLLEVLKRHKDDVLSVASVLLRTSEPSVRDYGSSMFKLAFVHFDSHMRRQVISDLIVHVGSGDSTAQTALEVLLQLAETESEKLSRLTVLLLNLLDNIDKLNLLGVRQMMDLLCCLAYAPDKEEETTLGDNISIMVHKQLGSFEPLLKRKGVVSAVMMLKHMVNGSGGDDAVNISLESSLESLPPGRSKDASELLSLVLRSTRTLPEALGYCFDQLSFMISRCSNLDAQFVTHVCERMEELFMASYLPEEEQGDTLGTSRGGLEITMSSQYFLDKDSEERIELGIGSFVLKEARMSSHEGGSRVSTDGTYQLLVLNPLFRLLRVLKYRSGDTNLEGIDALLGCALLMPSTEVLNDFNSFGPNQQSDILNCLFYCINWFREVVNAFVCCKPDCYQEKVLIRLRNVVALQSTLAKLLGNVMHYTPPQCMFYEKAKRVQVKPPSEKKKGKSKKSKKKKKKVNESAIIDQTDGGQVADDSDNDSEKENEEDANGPVDIALYRNFFREIDVDVFTLLKVELVMTPRPEEGADTTPELGPSELRFLLEDYVAKLEHSLPSGAANRFAHFRSAVTEGLGSFPNYDMIPVSEKATNAVSMLPILCEKLELVAESCRNLLDANDGIIDGPGMFVEGTADVKICFSLLLRAMCATFAWNGFQSIHNSELLTKGLKVLATRLGGHVGRRTSVVALVEEAAGYLKRFHEWILQLDAGAYLVKLLQVLSKLWELDASRSSARQNRINPTKSVLKDVCHSFLSRSWSTLEGAVEKGKSYTTHIDVLARVYLDSEDNKLTLLEELVPKTYEESKDLASKDSPLEIFPAICKNNFYILCRAMYDALVKGLQSELSKKNTSEHFIQIWKTVFKILHSMVEITQRYTGRNYLSAMLKHGWMILKLFLDKGMPVLESSLRHNPDDVTSIIRSSQATTRFLNKICLSSKTSQDSTLTSHVPKVRALLETLLYRVKAMLALNNVQSVWHMGNLRNRDVHNNELSTQESHEDDESDLSEPEDDRDDDITALDSEGDEEDNRLKVSQKRKRNNKKQKKARKSRDGDEDGRSSEEQQEESDDDDGNDSSVSTAY